MNEGYSVWFNGFLSAASKYFDIFQLEMTAGDEEGARQSLQRFTRGIHGATETLRNSRQAEVDRVERN